MVIMTKYIFSVAALGTLILGFTNCKPKYTEPNFSNGEINTERFVIIGDGHAGGYMNDALYREGQMTSLGYLLGQQFELAGGSALVTKLIGESSVGANANGQSRLKLDYKEDCLGLSSLSPVRVASQGDISIIATVSFSGEALFRDFGIPNMRASHLFSANYAQFNPYFARIASSSTVTPMQDILSTNPTFAAIYLGVEECMSYAKNGGSVDNMPSVADFELAYSSVVEQLHAQGAKGVLATIPELTVMPYFRTIPYNGLNLGESNANLLTLVFGALGYTFNTGANPFMINDPEANDFGVRQILEGELLLLNIPLDSVKCNQMGSLFPFRNEFVLTLEEQSYLSARISAYNTIIRSIAQTYNWALVETNNFYQKLLTGFVFNGVNFSAQFVTGGAFSLDGIHLNSKGNALLTNEFIKVINQHYGANIPGINANAYNGVKFP
jgi:hypothetical protein